MKKRWMFFVTAALLAASLAVAQERVPSPPNEDDAFEDAMVFEADADEGPGGPAMEMHGQAGMRGGMHMRGGGRRGMGRGNWMSRVDLTEEQRTKMSDIHDRSARRAIPIRSNLEIARLDLRKLLRGDKPAKSAVDAQIDKIAKLRGDLQKSQMQAMLEARDILTPEQREKMHGRGGSDRGGSH